jgi:hypothetical protein
MYVVNVTLSLSDQVSFSFDPAFCRSSGKVLSIKIVSQAPPDIFHSLNSLTLRLIISNLSLSSFFLLRSTLASLFVRSISSFDSFISRSFALICSIFCLCSSLIVHFVGRTKPDELDTGFDR